MAHQYTTTALQVAARDALVLGLGLAVGNALAETSVTYTLGHGQGNYQSHMLEGSLDLPGTPLELATDLLTAREAGATVTDQSGVGVNWRISPLWSAKYRWSTQKDTLFGINGHELGSSLHLDKWWGNERETRIDLGVAAFDYRLRGGTAAQNSVVPDQRRTSLGLRQDLTRDVALYVTFDHFEYSRDPVALAIKLLGGRRQRQTAAQSLTGFPDRSKTWGITWAAADKLDLDLSLGRARSVLGQDQDTLRLATSFAATRNANVTLALSTTRSQAVLRPNGATLVGKSSNALAELSWGWVFD